MAICGRATSAGSSGGQSAFASLRAAALVALATGALLSTVGGAAAAEGADPGLSRATTFAVGSFTQDIVSADFDEDGRLDLAVTNGCCNPVNSRIAIFLGDGAGGFAAAGSVAGVPDGGDKTLATGDFNEDGHVDLAAGSTAGGGIVILEGDGDGGFAGANVGTCCMRSIAVGDFDEDGSLDLALGRNSSFVTVRLGDGTGGFGPDANFGVSGCCVNFLTAGLMDGDAHLDLVVAASGNFSVLLGTGAGAFAAARNFASLNVSTPVLGDFDEDGNLDVVAAAGMSAVLHLGDGAGGLGPPTAFAAGGFARDVAAGDFDGDGNLDLAVANSGCLGCAPPVSGSVAVLLGDGDGALGDPLLLPILDEPTGSHQLTAADLDLDGAPDLAVTTQEPGSVTIFLNSPVVADTAPPAVDIAFPAPDGANGWFVTSPVVGSVTADDTASGGSGIAAITCTGATVGAITGGGTPSASAPLSVSSEGVNDVSCTATDDAGNTGSSATATIPLDSVAPAIEITSPLSGASYLLNAAVASSYGCDDATSGVAACVGPVAGGANIATGEIGPHAFTVEATDAAGNQAQETSVYQVVYDFGGFFSPVDDPPVVNAARAGSAIPVKFSLSGFQGLDVLADGFPRSQAIECDGAAALDGLEATVTPGASSLSYDATSDRYVYVWKTSKTWAGTCRRLVVRLADGTDHVAYFAFRR